MGDSWRKLKKSISLRLCTQRPIALDAPVPSVGQISAFSDLDNQPSTPTPSSSGLRLLKSGSRSGKKTCAICLGTMKAGQGHALFTAECSHSFHFNCITASVKHGNHACPICRSQWKEIPFQAPSLSDQIHGRSRVNSLDFSPDDRRFSSAYRSSQTQVLPEPPIFSDDEPLPTHPQLPGHKPIPPARHPTVKIKTFPEYPAIPASKPVSNFAVLVNIKGPPLPPPSPENSSRERAPVDLVAVLDVSGSMAGVKLALLKRAVGFMIQNLGPADRLSVVSFSSTTRRLFPLTGMSDAGRNQATDAVNSLVSSGGTNIVDGLKKGVRILQERREKNPVCSIILLSDGQDTYNTNNFLHRRNSSHSLPHPASSRLALDYHHLLPPSVRRGGSVSLPVHTFGFGSDHDAAAMHAIADTSGGTFSFIQAESTIQDAFARCIGGLLSVVAQQLRLLVSPASPAVRVGSIPAGNYTSDISNHGRWASVAVGDLYADEEKDFLVNVEISGLAAAEEMAILTVGCTYKDPTSQETIRVGDETVSIRRLENFPGECPGVCLEVDRQRNRLLVAEGLAEAQEMAEKGELEAARLLLETRRTMLLASASGQAGDSLCSSLEAELTEIRGRMVSERLYEESGRAYMLSELSSHSWQRATTCGDASEAGNEGDGGRAGRQAVRYQTPSMVDMVTRSQTLCYSAAEMGARPVQLSKSCTQVRVRGL